ncbi:TetR family transcriptional regulator C-terminal domain-containing protein [Nocardia wallacei]|uniref:TetR family transcriptional regulator C-terminal domain-containing protein n=1 Tax=Nocardia wallacei TaxID=480035 RepID=UPI0024544885|nr:TetR family transcriptional regulator C-terminal domain-containing protein [Nocardia wallacei]
MGVLAENRQLWLVSIEAGIEAQRSPRVRELMTHAMQEGRSGLAAGLLGIPEDTLDSRDIQTIGAVQLALMSGVLMQQTLDPDHTPDAHDITEGLLALAERLTGTTH